MKYAIYDKAADGYLTKMEFEMGYSDNTQFECGLNEYITEAKLLDTPKEAADAIARIESFKFMEKGRFVVHSFDDGLKDQYIISEAGKPTKVVNSITVDLDGNINVGYGVMPMHWSCSTLEYAINRMNALQKAKSQKYTAWCNTFDIYKVITVTDERSCTHYQFIKVTEKGLAEYAKDEVLVVGKEITDITEPLNKRIEELEEANYYLGKKAAARGATANRLREENDDLKTKVEAIKKEARDWKTLYENADRERTVLKNVIDNIYDDLHSNDMSKDLKETYDYVKSFSELHNIKIHNDDDDTGMPIYITANIEFRCIINKIIEILESRELNQSAAFSAAEDIKITIGIAEKIIPICEADDEFDVTLKKFSELYKAVNTVYDCNNDSILYAFNAVLEIFTALESQVRNIIDENVVWKNKAMKAVKDLNDQKRLNKVNSDTIDRMVVEKRAMNKELSDAADALKEVNDKNEGLANMLNEITNYVADIMYVTRGRDYDAIISKLTDISLKMGVKEADDGPIYGISVILNTLIRILKERNSLFALKDHYKRMANSIYGISIPGRCCGKQMTADVITGKKILVDKEKYDDLMECVNNISLTYEMMNLTPFSMDRPSWLSGVINRINDLTK